MKCAALIFLTFVLTASPSLKAQDKWQIADETTVRLSPDVFSHLPQKIVAYLRARHCTVPQVFGNAAPHNVIRGKFANSKQFDWAVLCSRNSVSSILVFWNGSTKSVAKLASSADKNFLQTIDGNGNPGYSRMIMAVDRSYILRKNVEYAAAKPPKITHQGINDAFVEKASSVLYFHRGRWLRLQGAD